MPPSERTLILLKPDAVDRGLCGEILRRFEQAGLRVLDSCRGKFTRSMLERHYADLRRRLPDAYRRTASLFVGRHAIAVVLVGPNAVAKARALVGPTDPLTSPAGTIRGDLSCDSLAAANAESRGLDNLVHASDSGKSARREIRLWFGQ